jgi:hypothetical protein
LELHPQYGPPPKVSPLFFFSGKSHFLFFLFIFVYNVWLISPSFPHPIPYPLPVPSLSPLHPCYPAETILPLSLILL